MKLIIVLAVFVALAAAAPADDPPAILRSDFDQEPNGAYGFNFETENGIARDEKGEVKQVLDEENKPHDVIVVRGSFSYTNPDGVPESINYYADETGYHAEGASIPKVAE